MRGISTEAARPRFEPWKRLTRNVRVSFKPHTYLGERGGVCVGKSPYVVLTLLIPALGPPFGKRCCRCAVIVLQNGRQMANRVTDVCVKSVIHGITLKISRQRAGCVCVFSGKH